MKTLLVLAVFLFALSVQAVEKIDEPFKFFLSSIDTAYITGNTAYFGLTPTIVIPDMILTNADSGKSGLDVQAFNSLGVGVDWGRYIKATNGKVYETFGVSIFTLLATGQNVLMGGAVHVFNRSIGIGGAADLGNVQRAKRFKILLTTGLRLF
jgi:hypothetical protein